MGSYLITVVIEEVDEYGNPGPDFIDSSKVTEVDTLKEARETMEEIVETFTPKREATRFIVTRDGKAVSPSMPTHNEAWAWILKHTPGSVHAAMAYEGYGIEEIVEVSR